MYRTTVQSSNITSIGFDREQGLLEVEFAGSGGVYQYHDVKPEEYAALLVAPSKGHYLHQHFIKAGRAYQRVEEQAE